MGNSKRGLASADEETRKEVARKGGKASRGGGRRSNKGRESNGSMQENENFLDESII